MLNTLFNRLHLATGSGEISGLYDEIVNNYNSGNLTQNFGNKGIDELYKRKRVTWHDFARDLNYLPVETTTTANMYFVNVGSSNWNDIQNWFFDASFTNPANRIPINGDTVFIYGNMTSPPSLDVSPLSITVGDIGLLYSFNSNVHILCDINLYGSCYIYGIVNSLYNVKLYNDANINGLTCSAAYLYNNSYTTNTPVNIADTIYLYDSSVMYGGTFTTALFYNSSGIDSSGIVSITSLYGHGSSHFDGGGNISYMYLYDNSYVGLGSTFNIDYAEFRGTSHIISANYLLSAIFLDSSYRGCIPIPSLEYSSTVADKIFGCMDPLASNYNPLATCDDGACSYIT